MKLRLLINKTLLIAIIMLQYSSTTLAMMSRSFTSPATRAAVPAIGAMAPQVMNGLVAGYYTQASNFSTAPTNRFAPRISPVSQKFSTSLQYPTYKAPAFNPATSSLLAGKMTQSYNSNPAATNSFSPSLFATKMAESYTMPNFTADVDNDQAINDGNAAATDDGDDSVVDVEDLDDSLDQYQSAQPTQATPYSPKSSYRSAFSGPIYRRSYKPSFASPFTSPFAQQTRSISDFSSNNPRRVLDISDDATVEEAKDQYKKLAKKYHPDVIGGDTDKFKKINNAYDQISNRNGAPESSAQSAAYAQDFDKAYQAYANAFRDIYKREQEIRQQIQKGREEYLRQEQKGLNFSEILKDIKTLKQAFQNGLDINTCFYESTGNKASLLSYAIENDRFQVAQFLIENGADVNYHDNNNESVLLKTIRSANVNYRDNNNNNNKSVLLDLKIQIIKLLIKYGIDVNFENEYEYYCNGTGQNAKKTALMYRAEPEITRLLIENGANVNFSNSSGMSALMELNGPENLQLLIDAGADVNHIDKKGLSVLMHKLSGSGKAGDAVLDIPVLIKAGADVNYANNIISDNDPYRHYLGFTPLMSTWNPETAQLLIDAGADVNYVNQKGESALSVARKYNREEMVDLLLKYGAIR